MSSLRETKGWRSALVCALVAQLIAIVAMAASPHLHELLHHDASSGHHECAVTVMVSGGSDGPPVPAVFETGIVLTVAVAVQPERARLDLAPLFLCAHVFEHAPPAA